MSDTRNAPSLESKSGHRIQKKHCYHWTKCTDNYDLERFCVYQLSYGGIFSCWAVRRNYTQSQKNPNSFEVAFPLEKSVYQ